MEKIAFTLAVFIVQCISIRLTPSTIMHYGKPPLLYQTVTAGELSAEVVVYQYSNRRIEIEANFTSAASSNYPVSCMSAYSDFRHKLVDSKARAVPVDQHVLAHPHGVVLISHHLIVGAKHRSCTEMGRHQFPGVASVGRLYPNLPAGSYTLQLTFAPRGRAQQVPLLPVQFVIK